MFLAPHRFVGDFQTALGGQIFGRAADGSDAGGLIETTGTGQARNRRRRSKKSIHRRERMIEDMRKAGVPEGQTQLAP